MKKQYTIAENLCRLCTEKNISVNKLAEAIDKSTRQVNRYRSGQCKNLPIDTLENIASVLGVGINDLLE